MKQIIIPIFMVLLMISSVFAIVPIGPIVGGENIEDGREYGPPIMVDKGTWTGVTSPAAGRSAFPGFDPFAREYEVDGKTCAFYADDGEWDETATSYRDWCYTANDGYPVALQGWRISSVDGSWTNVCGISYSDKDCADSHNIPISTGETGCVPMTASASYHFAVYSCTVGGEKECSDTDGGKDYKDYGVVTVTVDGDQSTFKDTCQGDQIIERICTADKSVGTTQEDCTDLYGSNYECYNGECREKEAVERVCTSRADVRCYATHPYYYDSCDRIEYRADTCESGVEVCDDGRCVSDAVCNDVDYRVCDDSGSLWIVDECGNFLDIYKDCNYGCEEGAKICNDGPSGEEDDTLTATVTNCYACDGDIADRQTLVKQPTFLEQLFGLDTGRAGIETDVCEAQNVGEDSKDFLYSMQPTCRNGQPANNPDYFKPKIEAIWLYNEKDKAERFNPDQEIPERITNLWQAGKDVPVVIEISNQGAKEFDPAVERERIKQDLGGFWGAGVFAWVAEEIDGSWENWKRGEVNAPVMGPLINFGADLPSVGSSARVQDTRISKENKALIDALPYLNLGIVEVAFYTEENANKFYSYPRYTNVLGREGAPEFVWEETISTIGACQGAEDDQGWINHYSVMVLPPVDGECWEVDNQGQIYDQDWGGACNFKIATSIKVPEEGDHVAPGATNWNADGKYYLHTAIFEQCWYEGIPDDLWMHKAASEAPIAETETDPDVVREKGTCCIIDKFGFDEYKLFDTTAECVNAGYEISQDQTRCTCPSTTTKRTCADKDTLITKQIKAEEGVCKYSIIKTTNCQDEQVCGINEYDQAACLKDIDQNNIPDEEELDKKVCCDYAIAKTDWDTLQGCNNAFFAEVVDDSFCVGDNPDCNDNGRCDPGETCSKCPAENCCIDPDPECGNGECEAGECKAGCIEDCDLDTCKTIECNEDQICDSIEDEAHCPKDCPGIGDPCTKTSQCATGLVCSDGFCKAKDCTTDTQCGTSQYCSTDFVCKDFSSNDVCCLQAGEDKAAFTSITECGGREASVEEGREFVLPGTIATIYGAYKLYNWVRDATTDQVMPDDDCKYANQKAYVSPDNDQQWCIQIFGQEDACFDRKEPIEYSELDNLDQLTKFEKSTKEYFADPSVPLCMNEFGDVQCEEGSECLKAVNSDRSLYKDNKKVYDALEKVVITRADKFAAWAGFLGSYSLVTAPFTGPKLATNVINWINGESTKEQEVELFGVCVFGEDPGTFGSIKRWIAKQLGLDPEGDTITYVMIAMVVGIILIMSLIFRPKKRGGGSTNLYTGGGG